VLCKMPCVHAATPVSAEEAVLDVKRSQVCLSLYWWTACLRSADGTARLYNTNTGVCLHTLIGHEGEISKVAYNPQVQ